MITLFERIRLLKQSSFFDEVDTDSLRFVAQALAEESYLKDEHLFDVNDYGNELYIITSGEIGIALESKRDEYIATLGPGDCFGEMNLLDGQPRSATAIALEDCKLLTLSKSNLRGLILSYPEIALGMLKGLSIKLRKTNQKARFQV